MSDKPRNVPNAADADKDETEVTNKMGHPERTVKQPGKPVKRVLNELDPECQDNIEAPVKLQEFKMARSRILENVQDYKGVKGDFMTGMGGRTDKLGGKQKNTGAGIEKFGESTSGEACDGITTKLKDLNLRTKQKNTGGGFETETIKDGTAEDGITSPIGTMGNELGQNSMQKNKGGQFETLKGSKSTMSGSVAEEWSLGNIATIMEGDSVNLQSLFESYSKNSSYVCLDDFQQLCNAHGVQTTLSEQNLKTLMAASRKFMFYEGNDASGRFWQPQPLSEMVGSGAVADAPVEEDDEIPIDDEGPDIDPDDVGQATVVPTDLGGDLGQDSVEVDVEVGGPDDLADVFQEIGVGFERAADLIAGHDESAETPEDEAAEGDLPFDDATPGEEVGEPGDEEEETECTEEVCEDSDIGDEASPESGNMMGRIGSSVKGKATAVAMKGREEDEKSSQIPEKHTGGARDWLNREHELETESRNCCARCGTVLDANGCMLCDLLRESEELGGMNGEDAKANKDGYYTADKTQKGQGELGTKIPPQETCESTSGAASDGITSEVPGKQTPLKPKMKNTGGQAAFKGGSGTMKENILRLSRAAKEAVARGAMRVGRAGKYTVRFGVQCEGSAQVFPTLTDALTVVEELLQVSKSSRVVLEALFSMPHQNKILYRHRLPLAKTKRRDPIACEGKILFKTGKVANVFADRVVSEGIACRVKNHNWGAAVTGQFSWPVAQKAFQMLPEAWGTQIRSPRQEKLAGRLEDDPIDTSEFGDPNLEPTVGDLGSGVEDSIEGDIDSEPEYNAEAPGYIDPEGNLCPNCGNAESPDEMGRCYQCGTHRPGGSSEAELGAVPDENLAGSDEYLDFWDRPEQPIQRSRTPRPFHV
jgi:hypothetical protein